MKKFTKISIFIVSLAVILFSAVSYSTPTPAKAVVSNLDFFEVASNGQNVKVKIHATEEHLDSQGTYRTTYNVFLTDDEKARVPSGISFSLGSSIARCDQGSGQVTPLGPVCNDNGVGTSQNINLNPSNNFSQSFSLQITQPAGNACGSFQSDIGFNGTLVAFTIFTSGVDCVVQTPTPTPTASPTPTPTPTPTASPTPTPTNPPAGQTQNQSQNQSQNQTVNVTNTNNNTSSSSSSISSSNTATTTPQVLGVATSNVKELPKTGVPLAGLALGGLTPLGLRLRKFRSKNTDLDANSIWEEKQWKL